jgi:hypothetical protein
MVGGLRCHQKFELCVSPYSRRVSTFFIFAYFASFCSINLPTFCSSNLLLNPAPPLDRLIEANEALFEVFYLWYFPFCIDSETLFS